MSKLPIVFSFNEKFRLPAYVAISSLLSTAKPETAYQIYVVHDGLEPRTVDSFVSLVGKSNSSIDFVLLNTKLTADLPHSSKWPPIVYARLFIPELFQEYQKVLYSDVDVIFTGGLEGIFNVDMGNSPIAAVPAEKKDSATTHQRLKTYKNELIFMSGLILFNINKCKSNSTYEKIERSIKEIGENQIKMFDLEVMNTMYSDICRLDLRYCILENLLENEFMNSVEYRFLSEVFDRKKIEEAIKEKTIIHYAGLPVKVWNRMSPPDIYMSYIKKSPFYVDWSERQRRKTAATQSAFQRLMSRFHPSQKRRKQLRELIKEYQMEYRRTT